MKMCWPVSVGVALRLVATVLLGAGTASAYAWQAATPDPAVRGIEFYKQGQYAQAEAALRGLASVEAKAYLAASIAKQAALEQQEQVRNARYSEAEGLANEALASEAAQSVAAEAVGQALVGLGKLDEAIERLTALIKAQPEASYAYYWRGKAYNQKKQTARMVDDFAVFLKLAPSAPEATAVRQLLQALR